MRMEGKCDLGGIIVGARLAGLSIPESADLLEFSHTSQWSQEQKSEVAMGTDLPILES